MQDRERLASALKDRYTIQRERGEAEVKKASAWTVAVFVIAAIVVFSACHPAKVRLDTAIGPATPEHIGQRISATYEAIAQGDTVALNRLLSDSLRWISPTQGTVLGKSQLLDALSRLPAAIAMRYRVDSVRIWQSGSTATAEYRLKDSRTFAAHTNTFNSRGMDVFDIEGGAWRLRQHSQTWVPQPPKIIATDTIALRAFVGYYDLGDGYVDDIHLEPSGLMATSSAEKLLGAPGARLLPISENAFSPDGSAPLIVFERDGTGHVTGYVQQQPDGVVTRARRISKPQ